MLITGFDTETAPISDTDPLPALACLSFSTDATDPAYTTVVQHDAAVNAFKLAAELGPPLTAHNVGFDLPVLGKHDPSLWSFIFALLDREGGVRDTMLREQLGDIRSGMFEHYRKIKHHYSLGETVTRRLGYTLNKHAGLQERFGLLRSVPMAHWPREALDYATADAAVLRPLLRHQDPSPDEDLQVRAAVALQMTSATGYVCDLEAVDRLELRLREGMLGHAKALRDAGIIRTKDNRDPGDKGKVGAKNMAKLRKRVADACAKLGESPALTDGGEISTAEDAIADLYVVDPILESCVEYAGLAKILNTYVPMLRAGCDRPVHTHYHNLLETGRTSSSEPSVQVFPRKFKIGGEVIDAGVRECIIARPGRVFVAADYIVAELKGWAQICYSWFGWSSMRDALIAGLDPHLVLAANMIGISVEDAHARYKRKDPEVDDARQTAKSANFGLLGGLGKRAFVKYARGVDREKFRDFDELKAGQVKQTWKQTWLENEDYFRVISAITGELGPREIVQYGSGRVRGAVSFTEAANGFFQSLVADMAKTALYRIVRACLSVPTSPLYGCLPQFFLHDEVVLEADERQAPYAAEAMREIMIETQVEYMPDVPPGVDVHLMRRFSKAAKTARDAGGMLIPWEDRSRVAA